jgi:AraC-like DNA-binding protein
MSGTTAAYAVDPLGEYVFGLVTAGAMEVRRRRERFVFQPGDACAWDPSAPHSGRAYGCARWQARLLILETPAIERIAGEADRLPTDLVFAEPLLRDARLARQFLELHRELEGPAWALARETLLMEWLWDASGGPKRAEARPRAARRDPALGRACDFLRDRLASNVTLEELVRVAGVDRHRLSRLFRSAFGIAPHRFQLAHRIGAARRMLERGVPVAEVAQATGFFDQSHLHRHFSRTLGLTPARYARLAAQTYKTPRRP